MERKCKLVMLAFGIVLQMGCGGIQLLLHSDVRWWPDVANVTAR